MKKKKKLISSVEEEEASDNENFSEDSLEEDKAIVNTKKKKKKKNEKLCHHKRKTYLELYQSRLAFEFRKYPHHNNNDDDGGANDNDSSELCENEKISKSVEDESETMKMNGKKQSTVLWSEYLSRRFKQQHALSHANSKTEMLKRRFDYGCRMSSMNRLNRLCSDLHKKSQRQRQKSSSRNQSLLNDDNESNENATSTSKITRVTKNSKDSSSCEMKKENGDELKERLEQMQIRHYHDRQKVEKIRNSLMMQK